MVERAVNERLANYCCKSLKKQAEVAPKGGRFDVFFLQGEFLGQNFGDVGLLWVG